MMFFLFSVTQHTQKEQQGHALYHTATCEGLEPPCQITRLWISNPAHLPILPTCQKRRVQEWNLQFEATRQSGTYGNRTHIARVKVLCVSITPTPDTITNRPHRIRTYARGFGDHDANHYTRDL